ncbi:MAG: DUF4830 domain-containing protein [Oscillospiraceae bacterium]|nr:DUF4830 domain-containing protein [Oscillospiraceae bacterium]
MIVFTTKLTRKKIIIGVIVICIIVCSAMALIGRNDDMDSVMVLENGQKSLANTKLKTNDDRVELLKKYGWEVDKEPVETMEVRIPEKFDGVYNEYNEIQKKQGLNLSEYAGKRVMRYTYKINNYPENEPGTVANLIIYKEKLIAGDVCSPKLGGFMHGLARETKNAVSEDTEENKKEQD